MVMHVRVSTLRIPFLSLAWPAPRQVWARGTKPTSGPQSGRRTTRKGQPTARRATRRSSSPSAPHTRERETNRASCSPPRNTVTLVNTLRRTTRLAPAAATVRSNRPARIPLLSNKQPPRRRVLPMAVDTQHHALVELGYPAALTPRPDRMMDLLRRINVMDLERISGTAVDARLAIEVRLPSRPAPRPLVVPLRLPVRVAHLGWHHTWRRGREDRRWPAKPVTPVRRLRRAYSAS